MYLIREMVSGPKHRYKDDNYNLDLTYIWPRIIAMSYPAEGIISTTYRNELSEVAKFLNEHHGDGYLVINLSQKKYNYQKFGGRVKEYEWVDHHSPYLPVMFEAAWEMHKFLKQNENNIVVVHCMAGKGRTGSLVSSYLLFSKAFNDFDKAIRYYKEKRMVGVTHPSQRRYVKYFEDILKSGPEKFEFEPRKKKLIGITFYGVPNFNNNSWRPQIDIYNVRNNIKIHSEKYDDLRKSLIQEETEGNVVVEKCELFFNKDIYLFGDVFVKVNHLTTLSSKKMFRLGFNTNKIVSDEVEFTKGMLDPDKTQKSPHYGADFKVKLFFENWEADDDSELIEQKAGSDLIKKILKEREGENIQEKDCQLLVFGDADFDDRDEMMVVNLDESFQSDVSEGDEA